MFEALSIILLILPTLDEPIIRIGNPITVTGIPTISIIIPAPAVKEPPKFPDHAELNSAYPTIDVIGPPIDNIAPVFFNFFAFIK